MSNKLAMISACTVLGSLLTFNVQAFPVSTAPEQAATPAVTLVRDFCGLNFHRGPDGYCVRNEAFYIYPPAPPPLQVVAPLGARMVLTSARTDAALRRWRAPTATTSVDPASAFHIGGRTGGRNGVHVRPSSRQIICPQNRWPRTARCR